MKKSFVITHYNSNSYENRKNKSVLFFSPRRDQMLLYGKAIQPFQQISPERVIKANTPATYGGRAGVSKRS